MLPEFVGDEYHRLVSPEKISSDASLSSRLLQNNRLFTAEGYETDMAQPFPNERQGFIPSQQATALLSEVVLDSDNGSVSSKGNTATESRYPIHQDNGSIAIERRATPGTFILPVANH